MSDSIYTDIKKRIDQADDGKVFMTKDFADIANLAFDIADIQIYGDREDVILTCSCYSIEDFVDEMKEMLTIQTFIPLDCYLIYDDERIYDDIKKILRQFELFRLIKEHALLLVGIHLDCVYLFEVTNSSLSIPISKIPDISTKIAASTLRFRLLSLVFALIRQNKGKLFLFTHRLLCPAVLRRSVLLPLSRVRRYSSWYSHPHVPEAPVRPLAVRRSTAGCL